MFGATVGIPWLGEGDGDVVGIEEVGAGVGPAVAGDAVGASCWALGWAPTWRARRWSGRRSGRGRDSPAGYFWQERLPKRSLVRLLQYVLVPIESFHFIA